MYARRVQIVNCGPIARLDINLPFEEDVPKPVLLVGENGAGKSIFLSYIVNGLISIQGYVYPETPEVDMGRVYKIRSNSYIKSGREFYYGRVDFEDDLFMEEIVSRLPKEQYRNTPAGLSGTSAEEAWSQMAPNGSDHIISSNTHDRQYKIREIYSKNCVLYFPPNRFEEPAWLNEENLKSKAEYMDLTGPFGYTTRKLISHSPLRDNQNWLFEVLYDRSVFEARTQNANFPIGRNNIHLPVPLFLGHSGEATKAYDIALRIMRMIMRESESIRFGVGRRNARVVSIMRDENEVSEALVPNVFQLSSGETSLLNLFLSILRDFDLCDASFEGAADIRGIVVVDEIDLHLHAVHQYDVLPKLIEMFPRVQFVVTTHSPLFALGMKQLFGEDGFALYRLPQGQQINPEEFSEFESAYQSFAATSRFSSDMRVAIENAQKPVVYVEGATDERYMRSAAQLLDQQELLGRIELSDGGGDGNLRNIWKNFRPSLAEILPQKVVLLHDCDSSVSPGKKGNLFRRVIPEQPGHPVAKGIENLFDREALEKAQEHKPAFIDIRFEHKKQERGRSMTVPEEWTVNENEKANLCTWLCENGTADDFRDFLVIFQLLEEILGAAPALSTTESP